MNRLVMHWNAILVGVLFCLAVSGCSPDSGRPERAQAKGPAQPPPPAVVVRPVVEKAVRDELSVIGTVEPNIYTTVSAEVAGLVERFDPREGDRVVRGKTMIAQLKRTDREIALREAAALVVRAKEEWEKLKRGFRHEEVNQRRAEVEEKRAIMRQAEKDFARAQELHAEGAISTSQLQRDEATYIAAKSQYEKAIEALREAEKGFREEDIAKAEAEYQRAQAAYDQIADELEKTTIRSSISGFIVKKHVEVGQWVNAGGGVADVVDLDPVLVIAHIAEKDIGQIRVTDRATLSVDTYPGQTFDGRVKHIVPQADLKSRAFPVKIEVKNPQGRLKSGMFARVTIRYGTSRPALLVPKDAVIRRGEGEVVFVVNGQTVHLQKLVTGRAIDGFREVIDGTLEAGDLVVVAGNEILKDGMPVQIIEK